jgi:hypothetical protein
MLAPLNNASYIVLWRGEAARETRGGVTRQLPLPVVVLPVRMPEYDYAGNEGQRCAGGGSPSSTRRHGPHRENH